MTNRVWHPIFIRLYGIKEFHVNLCSKINQFHWKQRSPH
jgi:hypothetical protein